MIKRYPSKYPELFFDGLYLLSYFYHIMGINFNLYAIISAYNTSSE